MKIIVNNLYSSDKQECLPYKEKDIWLKSAVIGSLWASVEIIMGSFFHNLQLPFAGTLLAAFTVIFIVAVLQIWNQTGLIWRAGLICALMKSISPSAVILGPMTGIFFEAVLLEIFIYIFGRNIFAYTIAGAMAVLSALLHKLLTLLIIYGWDSVKILAKLYRFAMKQLNIENINPIDALIVLTSIYVFLGIFAAITGYILGQKAKQQKQSASIDEKIDFSEADSFFRFNKNQKFSVLLLWLNIALVISGMIIINYYGLIYASVFAFGYIIFSSIRYKNAFRQFKRPFLWLQLVILTILASLFYTKSAENSLFNLEGLFIGLNMSVRAIIVILGFSSISVELRNPIVKTVLYKRGFSQVYNSLGLAFSALPSIISKVSKPKQIFKKPFKTIVEILLYMDSLLVIFTNENKSFDRK